MIYTDKIYGAVKIEGVLAELMGTSAMQRLKGVGQGGFAIFLDPKHGWSNFKTTRFEHSVGVVILLKRFNASPEEQIAGLLHDVSHTVFSHALDFMFGRYTEHDYHERFHKKIIMESDIPTALEKHGIDVDDIIDEKKFGILERPLPDLCADRIDYFLRDSILYGISDLDANNMLAAMKVIDGEIVFVDKDVARLFAEKYMKANRVFWCSPLQAMLFKLISDVTKLGITKGFLAEQDVFSTDDEVYTKLRNSGDNEIVSMLDQISSLEVVEDRKNYDDHLKSKLRCVDPKVGMKRLSELDKKYKEEMDEYCKKITEGFYVRIIRPF